MRKPTVKPNIFKVTAVAIADGAPISNQTFYVHAENATAARFKVKTYYRCNGLHVQLHAEKAASLFLPEALHFAANAGHIQDHRHLKEWQLWLRRYDHLTVPSQTTVKVTDSEPTPTPAATQQNADSFAEAFRNALSELNA